MATRQKFVAWLFARRDITWLMTELRALQMLASVSAWLSALVADLSTLLIASRVRASHRAGFVTGRAVVGASLICAYVAANQQSLALESALAVELEASFEANGVLFLARMAALHYLVALVWAALFLVVDCWIQSAVHLDLTATFDLLFDRLFAVASVAFLL